MFAYNDFYFRLQLPLIIIHITFISLSLHRTSAPIHLTSVLGVLGTQETSCILIAGLLERDIFDLFLPDVGVLDTGVSRSTYSWAPSSAHLQPRGEPMTQATKKTLTRRRLVRRTTTKTAKDQKTSSRAPTGEERDHVHVSSARLRAEQEDNRQKTAYRPRYPRQGGDQLLSYLPKAA
jgi:hypothetical protein